MQKYRRFQNNGNFVGNIDDTKITPGIYYINSPSSYTHASITSQSLTAPQWCILIQFHQYSSQMFVTDPILYRTHIGSPASWSNWVKFVSQ